VGIASLHTGQLKHPYKSNPLPNGQSDWLPIISVQVSHGSVTTRAFEAIVDSGSPDCLFHGDIARAVGIADITTGPLKPIHGVVPGHQIPGYEHEIRLIIGADNFKISAVFSDMLPLGCLLGRSCFFSRYKVCFDPEDPPGIELTRVHKKQQ
jgi:hypothetical protein